MLFLPISRSWLLSKFAQRVYFGCSILTFALVATLMGTRMALGAANVTELNSSTRSLLHFLLFPEIFGTALLWIAMWYFWFGFDRSHYLRKAVSFVLLFLLAPFGTIFYYFTTYRRGVSTLEPSGTNGYETSSMPVGHLK